MAYIWGISSTTRIGPEIEWDRDKRFEALVTISACVEDLAKTLGVDLTDAVQSFDLVYDNFLEEFRPFAQG